jgi:hypothetical protein
MTLEELCRDYWADILPDIIARGTLLERMAGTSGQYEVEEDN